MADFVASDVLFVFMEVKSYEAREQLSKLCNLGGQVVTELLSKCLTLILSKQFSKGLGHCQYVLDCIWERLNTGYWKDVDITWRHAYSLASLYKAIILVNIGKYSEATIACDMGLLLGAPILDNILSRFVTWLSKVHDRDMTKNMAFDSKMDVCNQGIDLCEDFEDFTKHVQSKDSLGDSKVVNPLLAISSPSLLKFQRDFIATETPIVIRDAVSHWPAFTTRRWSTHYIRQVAGHRTVPIELGTRYTSEDWTQRLMTINEFLDDYVVSDSKLAERGYLAQHELFDQVSELRDDIQIPDYCCLGGSDDSRVIINAWLGPKGTVSPLHHDPYHNLFVQVVGQKYIRLYDKALSSCLYPFDEPMLHNSSRVDVENPDVEKYPLFNGLPYFECVLQEGEMLYIPPKWWHYVRSLAISFSVSFWW